MNISILIVTNDFEKWIHNIQKYGTIYQQEKKLKLDEHVVLDKKIDTD